MLRLLFGSGENVAQFARRVIGPAAWSLDYAVIGVVAPPALRIALSAVAVSVRVW